MSQNKESIHSIRLKKVKFRRKGQLKSLKTHIDLENSDLSLEHLP
jgi:hypothetical protein